jgi:hypothetical protein
MKTWLVRLVKFLVITEIIYLALINVALNLPLTQTIVNSIRPEKYMVTWNRAWSFYPFRVHARTIFANGQSRSQQWQAEAPAASASISPVSLLWRTVKLNNIEALDVSYSQRPRPKPDKDYSKIRPYFPPIDNRELETEVVNLPPLKKGKKPWKITITDIFAHGSHEIWLFQIQGKIEGDVRTDLSYQTRGGPFSLSNGEVNVDLSSLIINGDDEVTKEGHVEGSVEFLPFVPKENKGIKTLNFLNVDASVQTETRSLAFLNVYLANFKGMKIDGTGLVQGRLHMRQGHLEDGSNVEVTARELSLELLDERLEGEGTVSIKTTDREDTIVLIEFARLKAFDSTRDALLFSGDGVAVEAQGNRSLLPVNDKPFTTKRLSITIPEVEVPDLKAYQAYLPEKWPFRLHGGKGKLQGFAEVTQTGLKSDLKLISEAADVGIKEYRFTTNLDMVLKADSPAIASGVDISGSYVHLKGATLSNEEAQRSSKPWHAGVDINQGKLSLLLPEDVANNAGFLEIYQELKGKEVVTLLGSGDEEIKITGSISDLSWLSVLFKNSVGLSISGSGEVSAVVILSQGWLGAGSKLVIHPQTLGVDVLDYSAEGNGKTSLFVEKGGEHPDLKLDVELKEGVMRRKDETQAFIEKVEMILQALVKEITIDEKDLDIALHLRIPKAEIRDMSVYNQYLPPHSPMEFTGGHANFSADIKMTPETANGFVKLRTTDISARVDQQDVSGELTADITLVDGVPENMDFDISGSSVTLDNVSVAGAEVSHDDENWSARFKLKKARVIWKKPINIQIEADLDMNDSKPIVAVIANQRGKHSWLEKALTIDDVNGEAFVNMEQDRIVIPYAFATSDKIDIGAKGVITADERNGVLYVRYRKLHGILKINDGKRNLDVFNARDKFDEFDSEGVLLQMSKTDTSTGVIKEAGN